MARFMVCLVAGLLWPSLVFAACDANDIRPTLSDTERRALDRSVAPEVFPEGNFWRASKGGQVIILAGTVHIADPRLTRIVQALTPDIVKSDVVFLEMTTEERTRLQNRLATDPTLAFLSDGSLDQLVSPDRWAVLSAEAEARGIPAAVAARFQPWYLSLVLALPPCVMATGEPKGLDAEVLNLAEASGIPTAALEPYDTLFTLFADEPLELQVDLLEAAALDQELNEDMIETTLNLYFEGKHAELWHLSAVISARYLELPKDERDALYAAMRDNLLDARNRDWIEILTARSEANIFAAFGAAHLFGEMGVLNLLQAEGYALERLSLP